MHKTKTYDYSKLLGRMKEKGVTQLELACEIGVSETTMSFSLMNKRAFKQNEMLEICRALEIPIVDVDTYFFSHKSLES